MRRQTLERYFKPSQVAKALHVHPHTVRIWLRNGHMDATKTPTGRWMVSETTLLKHLQRNNTI